MLQRILAAAISMVRFKRVGQASYTSRLPPTKPFIFYFSLMIGLDVYETTTYLSRIGDHCFSLSQRLFSWASGIQSHLLNPALSCSMNEL